MSRKRQRTSTITVEEKLRDIMSTTVSEMMKICFNEYAFIFSYSIDKNDNVVELTINIDNNFSNKHAYLQGQFSHDDNIFYSRIDMVESDIGFRVGTFLFDVFMYISILMKVTKIILDNDTDEPLRGAKGIYKMFKPIEEQDEDQIYDDLKYYFDNFDRLDEIYGEIESLSIKSNLKNNHLFMNLLEEYDTMDDIPEDLVDDLILERRLQMNNEMIYKVGKRSLLDIKNKIYELVGEVCIIDDPNNPWNVVDVDRSLKKIIGGKNIKNKSRKNKK